MFDMEIAKKNVYAFASEVPQWVPTDITSYSDSVFDFLKEIPEGNLVFPLGVYRGHLKYASLDKLPHLLVAGTTGSGKSVFLNGLIVSLLNKHTPDTLRMVLVDPKRVEFSIYKSLPHLLGPVASEVHDALPLVEGLVEEMDHRLDILEGAGVKDLDSYVAQGGKLPRIVAVIDEFADIILGAVTKEDKKVVQQFEVCLTRLAQKARAAGIHLVLATQKPIAKVVTSLLKGNIPARVALQVASASDSRVVLDEKGAESLKGKGDLLFSSPQTGIMHLQGVYTPDNDIRVAVKGG